MISLLYYHWSHCSNINIRLSNFINPIGPTENYALSSSYPCLGVLINLYSLNFQVNIVSKVLSTTLIASSVDVVRRPCKRDRLHTRSQRALLVSSRCVPLRQHESKLLSSNIIPTYPGIGFYRLFFCLPFYFDFICFVRVSAMRRFTVFAGRFVRSSLS